MSQAIKPGLVVQTVDLNPRASEHLARVLPSQIQETVRTSLQKNQKKLGSNEDSKELKTIALKEKPAAKALELPAAEKEIAFSSNPLPANPIKRNPIPPTPLERKTMAPPQKPEIPKTPANTSPATPIPAKEPLKSSEKPAVKGSQNLATQPKVVDTKQAKSKIPVKNSTKKNDSLDQTAADLKKQQELQASQRKDAEELLERQRQQKLVAAAEESIAKITGSHANLVAAKGTAALSTTPRAIASLQIDSLHIAKEGPTLTVREATYRDELASRLRLLLRLPEYGEVKVNLTLDRLGGVSKVVIKSAESIANRNYIEKTLPVLSFPAFGINFESATEYTFLITLKNE